MKILYTVVLCTSMFFSARTTAQILGTPIVHFDFATGIPSSWDSVATSNIAHWEYRGPGTDPDYTVASRGSCGFGSTVIQSQTYDNGFVIFDSNYWDDDGPVCGDLGSGQDPAPHNAALVTQSINLTGVNTVVLTWQQHFKRFSSALTVEVSNDGGLIYVPVYTAVPVFTSATEWQSVNINTLAANQANVKIRFLFTGTYYWWQLDDIALYTPNPNDIRVLAPKYTTYSAVDTLPFNNMEYDSYPSSMIPAFKLSAKDQNIGGTTQTGCKLFTKIKRADNLTQVFSNSSTTATIAPGNTTTHTIGPTYTAPPSTQDYIITYNVDQIQVDNNETDNWDTLDFRITPFSYARDERIMDDAFIPAATFQDELYEIGNIYQARVNNTNKCHSIGVAFANTTLPGSTVQGVIYNIDRTVIYGTTDPYVVNVADLNSAGDENITSLPLSVPLNLIKDSLYLVMVMHNPDDGGLMRIARSGEAIAFTSLVGYPESNSLYYLLKHPMVRMHIFPISSTPGCTDSTADNYNPAATVDDGGCIYSGCTNAAACNYDPAANWDDASCCYENCVYLSVALGSTDPQISWQLLGGNGSMLASGGAGASTFFCLPTGCYSFLLNDAGGNGWNGAQWIFSDENGNVYDSGTMTGGSSQIYFIPISVIPGCTDPTACNYQPSAQCDDGSCHFLFGCTNSAACNYDPTAICDNGTCHFLFGCTNPAACNYNPTAICDNGTCHFLFGCTNPAACNYNPTAICDNGTCHFLFGCTNHLACNYDPTAICDNGTCHFLFGCTNSAACNYDPTAICDDGSCHFLFGCTNPVACNYNPTSICDSGTCHFLFGCTNHLACNYDPTAICDNGTCHFLFGCTNSAACNYDPTAICDDGSCHFLFGCTDEEACNYDPTAICEDGSCHFLFGCTDEEACNYDPTAICDDGSCHFLFGCTNTNACNYDPTAICEDGSCHFLFGCTNVNACNYNPTAICDNGSCTFPGCNDPDALNYNPAAGCNDGSCEYCTGDLNEDLAVNVNDLLILSSAFGCSVNCTIGDINEDGVVNVADVLIFIAYFGSSCQ